MPFLYSGRILIADLNSQTTEERAFDESFIEENLGGALAGQTLYEEFQGDDPLVISTGPFTATMFPAGALGVITGKSPITGKLSHAPLVLMNGMDLKLTGFDFIVIKGKAENPVYFWLHDEIADIQDASGLWGRDTWETTETIRKDLGEDLIQVLTIGTAGEKGRNSAQVISNYWGTGDKWGFGKVFGDKKLKAIASRGLGLIEVAHPDEFVKKANSLKSKIKNGNIAGKNGIMDFCASIGAEPAKNWIAPVLHRYKACFACPYNCNTFLKYNENPKIIAMDGVEEPGFLMTDIASAIALKKAGLSADDAGKVLELCARLGIEPTCASGEVVKSGAKDFSSAKKAVEALLDKDIENTSPYKMNWGDDAGSFESSFSPWPPLKPLFSDFGIGSDKEKNSSWWKRRNSLSYILGICPIFSLMSPEMGENDMLEFIKSGLDIDRGEGFLDETVGKLKI
ncbi:MAG: hypothetical protein A3C43_00715 [Candidatus Schekmanbacteria bacterium RIFCSPHIGHO2_02_FULL_38_11]|uniref:Aldehyde ferredoxin oxidoreductase N-terminal domain-containing protein n=1 Tax=Candidatus Schekmanbacteria bacterium RIFCSPLOWO2_12_FULL_38_15 TaxID=1817883 RepID=A0A1F7SHU4_9BACT|nr:MAG: hypothetical protein A2043_05220 [Candidatus Schekmanbacteria bacterium GWA2_38_9]OGL51338.1 MAG: hypothetical protein A3H37_00290 [Candidatus Schekmanbacteria bacterium RIFCSPLOWO2_02_FULL_38_14]OGL53301.1 MAG: hypothetical protein A3G31_07260 [Candidatus Schekmanbacteria bacterium RIFCSPLOWO2_12_FULL_38_15]OGL55660.1 MAG: hypothetical protein A3C43_00715 [Candidatus Schekmanbacteria bacterium RIFCSPHIGHO2_02_FULL_38_11]